MAKLGIVISEKYWREKCWLAWCTPFLYQALYDSFDSVLIHNQRDYDEHKYELTGVFGGNAFGGPVPKIKYDTSLNQKVCYLLSDPHDDQKDWYLRYIDENNIDYILAFYLHPTMFHYPEMPMDKLVHFPWAIPDEYVHSPVFYGDDKVMIFGGMGNEAYSCRKWCSTQQNVRMNGNSCRNKIEGVGSYIAWLSANDAIIGAGSLDQMYQLVTPKYFEIAASGALLFAQYCRDLRMLGFDESNCVIFKRGNFKSAIADYLANPESYMQIRKNAVELIKRRHVMSVRMKQIKALLCL